MFARRLKENHTHETGVFVVSRTIIGVIDDISWHISKLETM